MQALAIRGDLPNVHYGLATVCYLMNDLPNASHHFREVIRLDPLRAGAYINLGAIYNKLNQLEEAISVLRKGIQLDHKRAEGYYNLGLVYRRQGKIDLAIQAYKEATRINPRMNDAHFNLANIYVEKGQYNLAVSHYEHALEVRPNWQKAAKALEQTQAILRVERGETEPVEPENEQDEDPTEKIILDINRQVDPEKHGSILKNLHRATIDSENQSRDFVQLLTAEIESAIKDMSSGLLYSHQSSIELDQCVQKVEKALEHLESAQKTLQNRMEEVRFFGDKLVQS